MDEINEASINVPVKLKSKIYLSDFDKINQTDFNDFDLISFDCFDTVLWRKVDKPTDIFFMLEQSDLFKKYNLTAYDRVRGEGFCRKKSGVKNFVEEVSLLEIYKTILPNADETEIQLFIKNEIELEKNNSFVPENIFNLLQVCFKTNKNIIIVSDTYFNSDQIKELLSAHLGKDVVSKFKHIFTSADCKTGKYEKLFKTVLKEMKVCPERMIHIGDNKVSDCSVPLSFGINAIQFAQYSDQLDQMRRMYNLGLKMLDTDVHQSKPIYRPFKQYDSLQSKYELAPANLIGYHTLGPMMSVFADYILSEYKQIKLEKPAAKLVFLLRDAYLPNKICEILNNDEIGQPVRISRFVSYASSFRSSDDIINYLSDTISGGRYKDICQQLLLKASETNSILEKVERSENKKKTFISIILSDEMTKKIINRSKECMDRLSKYLKKSIDLKSGDTLVLVDLGYSATTQEKLTNVFKNELGVELIGRYLICLKTIGSVANKSGLIHFSNTSFQASHSLVAYIALLEQLCTTRDKSVVDFDQNGDPIYSSVSFQSEQYQKLQEVQSACMQFARDARADLSYIKPEMARQIVIGSIARLLYLPSESELEYLSTFKFDLNLGTDDLLCMYDTSQALSSLQRRGMFFMEKQSKLFRTNYPAELRYFGLELSVMLLAQHSFGLEFTPADMNHNTESISLLLMRGNQVSQHMMSAKATFGGCYSLIVPMMKNISYLSVEFGKIHSATELLCVEVIKLSSLYSEYESRDTVDISSSIVVSECQSTNNFYLMQSESGMIGLKLSDYNLEDTVLRITYKGMRR